MGEEERIYFQDHNRKGHETKLKDILYDCSVKHGHKYDYSLVEYKGSKRKVKIICPIHGVFEQLLFDHRRGFGCRLCGFEKSSTKRKMGNAKFLQKAKQIHGEKYSYEKTDYVHSEKKVCITCPVHGDFEQLPLNHLNGHGCPQCAIQKNSALYRYGTDDFVEKSRFVHGLKYNYDFVEYFGSLCKVKIVCPLHGVFFQRADAHLRGVGCPICGKEKASVNKIKNYDFIKKAMAIHGEKYDYSLVDYKKITVPVKIICAKHGMFEQVPANHLKGSGCIKCSNQYSKYEEFLECFLRQQDLLFQRNIVLDGTEVDFFIPSHNIAIEVDGLYWHSELRNPLRGYHLKKTEALAKQNIRLIHIFENEFIYRLPIVKSRLKALFKKQKYSIFARCCSVREITNKEKNRFLQKYHLQGNDTSSIKLGLYSNNRLVSVMTFSKLRVALGQRHIHENYELSRFCSVGGFNVVGGASKLLAYFEKTYHPKKLVSYADRRWSAGQLYSKLGFTLDHFTPKNYWYFDHKCNTFHRYMFRKHVLGKKLPIFDKTLTEWENMKRNGFNRIWDCGSYCFIKRYC